MSEKPSPHDSPSFPEEVKAPIQEFRERLLRLGFPPEEVESLVFFLRVVFKSQQRLGFAKVEEWAKKEAALLQKLKDCQEALDAKMQETKTLSEEWLHRGLAFLIQNYQTCGRCRHWKDFDRSQTDDEGECLAPRLRENGRTAITEARFSCSEFSAHPPKRGKGRAAPPDSATP